MAQIRSDVQHIEDTISSPATGFAGKFIVFSWAQEIARRIAAFCLSQNWVMCLSVGGIALGFNLFRLGMPSLWFDEILSVNRAIQSLPELLQIIRNSQPNMALYYILLHFWLGFTGLLGLNPVEWVVRLPSAVFAALASMVVFLLGRRFISTIAGLAAAAIYLLNDLQLVYAQQTRSYALQLLLICIAWYALFAILTGPARQKRWWVCFTLAMTLAAYTQLFSYLVLMAQIATFGILLIIPTPVRKAAWQQFRNLMIALGSMCILTLPMIYESRKGSRTGWIPIPQLKDIYHLFLTIADNSKYDLLLLFALCFLAVAATALASSGQGRAFLQQISVSGSFEDARSSYYQHLFPITLGLVCWIIIPVILSFVISQSPIRLFLSRYLVTIVPTVVLLVGVGISVIRWRAIQAVVLLALVLLALHYVPFYYQSAQVEDWNSTSHWLEQHYQTNDGLVCFDSAPEQGCEVSIQYYLTAYPSKAHFTPDSPGTFSYANYDATGIKGDANAAVDPDALSIFAAHHPRIFYIIGRLPDNQAATQAKSAVQWLDAHYQLIGQIVTRTVTIRLYATQK